MNINKDIKKIVKKSKQKTKIQTLKMTTDEISHYYRKNTFDSDQLLKRLIYINFVYKYRANLGVNFIWSIAFACIGALSAKFTDISYNNFIPYVLYTYISIMILFIVCMHLSLRLLGHLLNECYLKAEKDEIIKKIQQQDSIDLNKYL